MKNALFLEKGNPFSIQAPSHKELGTTTTARLGSECQASQ